MTIPTKVGWRGWFYRIMLVLAVLLAIAAFLPLWSTDIWWVRMLDYPRLQLAGIGIVLIVFLVAGADDYRRKRFGFAVGLLMLATLWQLLHTARYLRVFPTQMASAAQCPAERSLSILNANVLLGNDDYGGVIDLVRETDPDVVVLLEAGMSWQEAMKTLSMRYPHHLAAAIPNSYGMLFWSKLPFDGEVGYRIAEGLPSIDGTITLGDGSKVALHVVHPEPPLPGDDTGERDAELVMVGREVRDDGRAAVVFGDLNDVAWSQTSRLFLDVSGMKDPRVGRGLYPTFNAKWPLMRWPLDHLFASPHFQLNELRRERDIGSDHFPIYFSLCLVEDADQRMVSREADPEDEAEAQEQLEEGRKERIEER
ncbi:endonuclease/exonuclease/phosphatase family protein [Sphingomicrobium nitratireducens]|uniref:endonuclease/exonuclease/phosphatase family protein n=1 Tax=Sphingomicrobium nitratireducens TaxID=2964666 RepID=UPI00223F6F4C|nr:endonuclease/exonuclease/phosphatase family protein [Sphingomicrobium nitratireducens]